MGGASGCLLLLSVLILSVMGSHARFGESGRSSWVSEQIDPECLGERESQVSMEGEKNEL